MLTVFTEKAESEKDVIHIVGDSKLHENDIIICDAR